MRGFIRRAIHINSWYWIIALSILVGILYITFSLPNADAITRNELDILEEDENILREKIKNYDKTISSQHNLINKQDKVIEDLKDKLRAVQDGASWDLISAKIDLEKQVSDAQTKYKEYRADLFSFLTEKSNIIKELRILEKTISSSVIESTQNPDLAKKIGITISNTCISAIKNNVTNPCGITYKNLITLDSSDTDISGKFTTKDGYFHRAEPMYTNSWRAYDFDDKLRIFVDPPKGMAERIKTIEIRPNFDTYTITTEMTQQAEFEYEDFIVNKTVGNITKAIDTIQIKKQTQDFGRILYHDRYVDAKCNKAIINADKVSLLLADTINYMRNDCKEEHTSFVNKEVIPAEFTEIDIATTASYQYNQWLSHVKNFCIFKFRAC